MKRIKLMAAAAIMAAVATAGYMGYTAYEYATMTPQERLMLANIEALTRSEPGGDEAIYDKVKSNCTKTFTIDSDGYVTVLGKRIYVGVGVSSSYTVTHSDAQIDCLAGSSYYTCTERTCEEYWNSSN